MVEHTGEAEALHRSGYRTDCRNGQVTSPEDQVRNGLALGWRYHDVAAFMKSTGVMPDAIRGAIKSVKADRNQKGMRHAR